MSDTKKEKPKRIQEVSVNRTALKKAANLEEFKKANPEIFSHLADQDAAYAELWAEGYSTAPAAAAIKAPTSTAGVQDPSKV